MDKFTYYLTATASSVDQSARYQELVVKGPTEIEFDFSNIDAGIYPIFKINIDWGDGSERILKSGTISLSSGLVDDIRENVSHIYYPSPDAYFTSLTAQIQILFSNFTAYTVLAPIKLAQTSYLKQYKSLSIVDAQFIDSSTDDMFVILQSERGDIYNVVLKL